MVVIMNHYYDGITYDDWSEWYNGRRMVPPLLWAAWADTDCDGRV